MYYKGNYIGEIKEMLLLDILQTQQEILAELKKLNKPAECPQDEPESAGEELPVPIIEQVEKPVMDVQNEVKKSAKKQAKRKSTKKKTQSKKATK